MEVDMEVEIQNLSSIRFCPPLNEKEKKLEVREEEAGEVLRISSFKFSF